MSQVNSSPKGFGTAPVFFTAISTILGAILFLRFGYATGMLGFWGVFLIVLLGHALTIPTALAISELATNKRVEGGGEYFIISRSFGLNIGSTIGISLFMSQAISVAFYVIAFTEAFEFFFNHMLDLGYTIPRQVISIPMMLLLAALILSKGANLGVKALYIVVAILIISLLAFFLGSPEFTPAPDTFKLQVRNPDSFFTVFAIVFPAFTGMTAGVGLSGDLRNPAKSIPVGTIAGTLVGMVVYVLIIYKLSISVSAQQMIDEQLIMSKIAIAGAILIPVGLAASTISSALGSVMVAPRTLQALAYDKAFPSKKANTWLAVNRLRDGEPNNASIITVLIALIFVSLGDINAVAQIISMFFMVTYGSLSLISFLHHFGSSPSYRPSFKSRWYLSLIGFLLSFWVMFKINTLYAIAAIIIMILLYLYISYYHRERKGLQSLFANSILQLNRNLQVYLQKFGRSRPESKADWRPSAICFSRDSFERSTPFEVLNWISFKYGFGTYMHVIDGYYSKKTAALATSELDKLIKYFSKLKSQVYVDTIISPSYTSAISQTIQIPGIAGMENNMVIFEFDMLKPESLSEILDNYALVHAGAFDVLIVGSSKRERKSGDEIHIWIKGSDAENANLMIMLGFIILGHQDWKKSKLRIFEVCDQNNYEATKEHMQSLLRTGRLPITKKNIEIIVSDHTVPIKERINQQSKDAGLTIIGFRGEKVKEYGMGKFEGYENLKTVLFVNSEQDRKLE